MAGEASGDHVLVFARPGVSVTALAEARRFLRRPVKLSTVSVEEFLDESAREMFETISRTEEEPEVKEEEKVEAPLRAAREKADARANEE